MKRIEQLRDAQRLARNPGHELGTFLLRHSNSTSYLVGQLEAYLEAARADLAAEQERFPLRLNGEALQEARRKAIEEAWDKYDFDEEGIVVEDCDGWENVQPGNGFWRVFYEEDQDGGPSIRHTFTVTFETGSAKVKSVGWS